MLDAGREVFAEAGYSAATMREIAARARVAPQTLYFFFHTKPDLFRAVIDYSSSGELERVAVPDRSWYRDALSSSSPARVLELILEGGSSILERISPLSQAIAEAAALEPEVAQRQKELATSRRRGIQRLVSHLGALGALRPGLAEAEATDVIFVLVAPETFRRFAACGWEINAWKRWVLRSLSELILAPTAR